MILMSTDAESRYVRIQYGFVLVSPDSVPIQSRFAVYAIDKIGQILFGFRF